MAVRQLIALFGRRDAPSFGPVAHKAVREEMVKQGLARKYINAQIRRIRFMFSWAVEEELIPGSIMHALTEVKGLRRGKTDARETAPVKPAPDEDVDAVRSYVSRQVWAIVELQRLTGMRSGEVIITRGCDLDMTGRLWLYRPASHKTEHHGHERIVEIGPRAQEIIRPFLKPDLGAYLFSPADAVAKQKVEKRRRRKTRVQPSQRDRSKRNPKRTPRDRYTPDSYRRAVTRACDKADAEAKKGKGLPPDSERIIARWHPHQLRHNYATRVRREYGIETARILLGHRSVAVTEVYAEVDRTKVREIVARIG